MAWITAVLAVVLVAFGGTVTTLRAGMAETNWIHPDGYFLWNYPLERYLSDRGIFVEHSHRLVGSLVGLCALATAFLAWLVEPRAAARRLAWIAVLAVGFQGLIGGLRVLKNSPDLAFLHGVLGQAVFAVLAATVVVLSPRFARTEPSACKTAAGLHRATLVAVVLTFLQVSLGAWFRHSGNDVGLALHVLLALGVLGAVVVLGRRLKSAVRQGEERGQDRRVLLGIVRRLHLLIGTQILLGVLATFCIYEVSGGMQAPVSVGEAITATAHVLVGALLLAQTVAAAMWTRRALCAVESLPLASLEGAR